MATLNELFEATWAPRVGVFYDLSSIIEALELTEVTVF
jgi:hypothetical protein